MKTGCSSKPVVVVDISSATNINVVVHVLTVTRGIDQEGADCHVGANEATECH